MIVKTATALTAAALMLAGCANSSHATSTPAQAPPHTVVSDARALHLDGQPLYPDQDAATITTIARQMCHDYHHPDANIVYGNTTTASDLVRNVNWTWPQAGALQMIARVDLCPDVLTPAKLRQLRATIDRFSTTG